MDRYYPNHYNWNDRMLGGAIVFGKVTATSATLKGVSDYTK